MKANEKTRKMKNGTFIFPCTWKELNRYVRIKSFLTVGVILLPFVIFGNLVVVLLRMKHHELKKGRKYAKLHTKIENSLIQALYDDGYYVERNVLFKKWSV